jgi:hypothetical protein
VQADGTSNRSGPLILMTVEASSLLPSLSPQYLSLLSGGASLFRANVSLLLNNRENHTKILINKGDISNKMAKNMPEKFFSLFFPCYWPGTGKNRAAIDSSIRRRSQ